MTTTREAPPRNVLALMLDWTFVGVPLAWGIAQTVAKALALFR